MSTAEPVQFSDWLAAQLAARQWTRNKLAAYLGLNPSSVSRWFTQSGTPNPATCGELARVLHVPLETVLRAAGHLPPGDAPLGAVPPSSLDPEIEAIARALASKPERLAAWLAAGRALAALRDDPPE